jgi:hypothetical protein
VTKALRAIRPEPVLGKARRAPCRTSVPPVRRPSVEAGRVRRRRSAVVRRRAALASMCGAIVILTLLGGGTAPASKPGAPRAVIVRSGQTLWGLAERYAPEGFDARAYVDAVVTLNHLSGPPVVGQRLRLPR